MSLVSFDFLAGALNWLNDNVASIVASGVGLVLAIVAYRLLRSEITRLKKQGVLTENSGFMINRLVTWVYYVVVGVIVFNLLGLRVDLFVGLWVLAGGTVIGFASMNTIGNAIAGLILMVSRPFKIGDRLLFKEQFVDVEDIELIHTRMRTTSNVLISVPNQMLLNTVIENYGVSSVIRRSVVVMAGYDMEPGLLRRVLVECVASVDGVLGEPAPFTWMTDFPNVAMEYTLYYFVQDSRSIPSIDSMVRGAIFSAFKENGIGLETPNLITSIPRGDGSDTDVVLGSENGG